MRMTIGDAISCRSKMPRGGWRWLSKMYSIGVIGSDNHLRPRPFGDKPPLRSSFRITLRRVHREVESAENPCAMLRAGTDWE